MIRRGDLVGPSTDSVLYPRRLPYEASPKAISGRTSYHPAWKDFYSYPQLIPNFFSNCEFGPPSRGYRDFTLTKDRSLGFGSATGHCVALFALAFATASLQWSLTLRPTASRRFIKQKARGHPPCGRLPPLVCIWFQVLFHSPRRGSFHLSLALLVHYRLPEST